MDTNVEKKLDKFFSQFNRRTYKRKEILIRADEKPSGVFFLKEGVVRMYAISINGEEITINTFKATSFFPMDWVINNSNNRYCYEAMTSTLIFVAPKVEFLEFIKNEPEILLDLLKRIYRGLEGYFMKMEHLMLGSAQARLITELLIYAKRFGEKKGNRIRVEFNLTEKDLATQSGLSRETVSREIQKLKQKGLIALRKNILLINDLAKLEEQLSPF